MGVNANQTAFKEVISNITFPTLGNIVEVSEHPSTSHVRFRGSCHQAWETTGSLLSEDDNRMSIKIWENNVLHPQVDS